MLSVRKTLAHVSIGSDRNSFSSLYAFCLLSCSRIEMIDGALPSVAIITRTSCDQARCLCYPMRQVEGWAAEEGGKPLGKR